MEQDSLAGFAAVRRLLTIAGCIAVTGLAAAATLVDSAASLTAALEQANPGDEIQLRHGV